MRLRNARILRLVLLLQLLLLAHAAAAAAAAVAAAAPGAAAADAPGQPAAGQQQTQQQKQQQQQQQGPAQQQTQQQHSHWAVMTSTRPPSAAVKKLAALDGWRLLVVADLATPADWAWPNVTFLSVQQQKGLGYAILDHLPWNNYGRKNVGYLYALQHGAQVIYDVDDDNELLGAGLLGLTCAEAVVELTPRVAPHPCAGSYSVLEPPAAAAAAVAAAAAGGAAAAAVFNPYPLFGQPQMWPRGLPLEAIKGGQAAQGYVTVLAQQPDQPPQQQQGQARDQRPAAPGPCFSRARAAPLIQQGLANADPDVDALYRLALPLGVAFDASAFSVVLPAGLAAPFNSQNTLFLRDALWALLLPVTTPMRVADIWRAYWAQRLLWDAGGALAFVPATVEQRRNPHSLLDDLGQEVQLYQQAGRLVRSLAGAALAAPSLPSRMVEAAQLMADGGFWGAAEVDLARAWVADLARLGYTFPRLRPAAEGAAAGAAAGGGTGPTPAARAPAPAPGPAASLPPATRRGRLRALQQLLQAQEAGPMPGDAEGGAGSGRANSTGPDSANVYYTAHVLDLMRAAAGAGSSEAALAAVDAVLAGSPSNASSASSSASGGAARGASALDHAFLAPRRWCLHTGKVLLVNLNFLGRYNSLQQLLLLRAAYRPLFARVVFTGAVDPRVAADGASGLAGLVAAGAVVDCAPFTLGLMQPPGFYAYRCAAAAMAAVAADSPAPGPGAPRPAPGGAAAQHSFLYINDDVLLSPCMLGALNASRLWYSDDLAQPLPLGAQTGWHWAKSFQGRGAGANGRGRTNLRGHLMSAMLSAHGRLGGRVAARLAADARGAPTQYFREGQGDFFYVPRQLVGAFIEAASHMRAHYVMSEVAVPAILGLLRRGPSEAPSDDAAGELEVAPFGWPFGRERRCLRERLGDVLRPGAGISRASVAGCAGACEGLAICRHALASLPPPLPGVDGREQERSLLGLHGIKLSKAGNIRRFLPWWLSQECAAP